MAKSMRELRAEAAQKKAEYQAEQARIKEEMRNYSSTLHTELGTILERINEYVGGIAPQDFDISVAKRIGKTISQWASGRLSETQVASLLETGTCE